MVAVAALITTVAATPLAMRVASRVGLVDRPGPLKVQSRPVPYLGGVAVAAGLAWGVATARPGLLLPLGIALAVGIADDAVDLPPAARLGGEALAGLVLGLLVPLWEPRVLGVLFAVALTIALCNSINMVDGLDGLAGGVTLAAAVGFYVVLSGHAATIALALAVSVAAFLAFNLPPAGVYLGDGGAYLLGTALATLFVLACQPSASASFDVALLFVGYPLVELVFAIVRRTARGQSPFAGDREHMYDQLHRRGAPAPRAAAMCVGLQAVLVVAGILVAPHSETAGVLVAGGCGMMILVAGVAGGFAAPETRRG